VKHAARVGLKDEAARPPNVVPLFRLNSVLKQPGRRDEDDEEPERQQWDNPIEFLLSCISMSVGLGNVWRFPFTAYENGGGAFLIPYILVLLLVGRPLYFLELALGQFSSSGSVRVWDMVPALGGDYNIFVL
jgi:solute carrier family 6 amino acid transporter-like protein 5/7/9/14